MKTRLLFSALAVLGGAIFTRGEIPALPATTYRVEQNVTLSEIPAGAKHVKWWISIPDNERYQEVLDFKVVSAPGRWSVVREPDRGNRFMLIEAENPGSAALTAKVEFTLRRRAVFTELDPAQAGPITDSLRTLYAEELRPDQHRRAGAAAARRRRRLRRPLLERSVQAQVQCR
jgi:hypothetical protein